MNIAGQLDLTNMLLRELIKIVFCEERKVVFWENSNIMSK